MVRQVAASTSQTMAVRSCARFRKRRSEWAAAAWARALPCSVSWKRRAFSSASGAVAASPDRSPSSGSERSRSALGASELSGGSHADEVARGSVELEEAGAVDAEVVEHGRDDPRGRLAEVERADQLVAHAGEGRRGLLRMLSLRDVAHDHEELPPG